MCVVVFEGVVVVDVFVDVGFFDVGVGVFVEVFGFVL